MIANGDTFRLSAKTLLHRTKLLRHIINGLRILKRKSRRRLAKRKITGRLAYLLRSRRRRHRAKYSTTNADIKRHAGFGFRNRENQYTKLRDRVIKLLRRYKRVRYHRRRAKVSSYNRILTRHAIVERNKLLRKILYGKSYFVHRKARRRYRK